MFLASLIIVRKMVLILRLHTLCAASLLLGAMGNTAITAAVDRVPVPRAKHSAEHLNVVPSVPQSKPVSQRSGPKVPEAQPSAGKNTVVLEEPCAMGLSEFVEQPPVVGENGCGFSSAVQLVSTGGERAVRFQPAPIIGCKLAGKLADWLTKDASVLASEIMGEQLIEIRTGPGYACRRRNNLAGGKLSEHALGRALDITAFVLKSGAIVSVEQDWTTSKQEDTASSRFLRSLHISACKRFTTVLGPEADAHHTDHFHLDIGCHGKTCTYRICQ